LALCYCFIYLVLSRSPRERATPLEGADPSDCQEKNQMYSHEATYESFDGVKKFSMSYNKINQGGKNGTNGTTHIAQLHAVPGYTCLIDEITPLHMTGSNKPVSSAVNDAYHTKKFSEGVTEGVCSTEVVKDLPAGGASKKKSKSGVALQNKSDFCGSDSIDMLFGAYESGHGHSKKVSPSSSPLPKLHNTKSDFESSAASKFGVSGIDYEGAGRASSPSYFDEEVDVNSYAAASVAALKKAIEEAQASMKIVKESMARKKEGLQNRVKLSSNHGQKDKQRREGKVTDKTNKSKGKKDMEMYKKEDAPLKVSAGTREQNGMREGHLTPDFGVREKSFGTKAALGETCERELKSTQADHRQEAAKVRDAVEPFYGLAKRGKHKVKMSEFEQADNIKKEVFEKPEECRERSNTVKEAHKKDEIERKIHVVKGAVESEEHEGELKSAQRVHDQEENEKKLGVVLEQEDSEKKVQEICEEKLRDFQEPISYEGNIETLEFEENEDMKGQMEAQERGENEKKVKETCEEEDTKREQEDVHYGKETEKRLDKVHEHPRIEMRFDDFHEEEENGKSLKENGELEGNEKLQEAGENERLLKGSAYQIEEKEKRQKETCESIEAEKTQIEIDHSAEDEKKFEVVQEALNYNNLETADDQCKQDKSENPNKHQEASRHIENDEDVELNLEVAAHEKNGSTIEVNKDSIKQEESGEELEPVRDEKMVTVAEEALYHENNLDATDDRGKQDERESLSENQASNRHIENDEDVELILEVAAHEKNGSTIELNKDSIKQEEIGEELEPVRDEKTVTVAEEALYHENNLDATDDRGKQDERESLGENQAASRHKENDEDVELILELAAHEENGSTIELNKASVEQEENGIELETVKDEKMVKVVKEALYHENNIETIDDGCKQDERENLSESQESSRHVENDKYVEVTQEVSSHVEKRSTMKVNTASFERKENQQESEAVKYTIETIAFDSDGVNSVETEMSFGQKQNEQHAEEHEEVCNLGRDIEELDSELGKIYENIKEVEVAADQEEDWKNSESFHKERWVDDGNKVKATQLPSMFEGEGKSVETAQEIKITQTTEKHEENHQSNMTIEEKESNDTLQKEVELEKQQFKKIDEVKKREREREREKMVVERAIREARERAFAEARERAERAAAERASAEARRRGMAEAREKLGKNSAEANEKLSAEKTAMEAKLKAERAAVERATAEARERALERAMSEKFSGASRDDGRRQSFSTHVCFLC